MLLYIEYTISYRRQSTVKATCERKNQELSLSGSVHESPYVRQCETVELVQRIPFLYSAEIILDNFYNRPNLLCRYWRVDWRHPTPPGPWWTAWRDGSSTPTTTTGKSLMMTFAYSSVRYLFCVCRSIVSDFSWVCEEAWVPTLSQAMFFVGKH